jgi:hypothetical protein
MIARGNRSAHVIAERLRDIPQPPGFFAAHPKPPAQQRVECACRLPVRCGTNVAARRNMSSDRVAAPNDRSEMGRDTCIYWHRQLPPLSAEMMGEHVVEATSNRVHDSLAQRDELWERCYRELMDHVEARLQQEICRLGGDYAHVLSEAIDSRRDDRTGEAWLHGRFDYALYRRGAGQSRTPSLAD